VIALSLVTREDAMKRLAQLGGGAPDSFEALCDLVRAEVHARMHAPRAVTLSRVARLLAPAALIDEERLDELCDALEREGDLVLAPGGILYATPTRAVTLGKIARVFSSLPTRALAAALGREISTTGATRAVASTDGLSEAVAKVRGVMVTPEAWAGLDRTPRADAAFLAKLDQRLEWEALNAGALEKDGALEWRTWQAAGEGAQWRRRNEGRLWWARTRFGGHHRAWTANESPSRRPFVELSADEADRARFALSREVAGASLLRVERTSERATIQAPGWLPRPEYRWLSLHVAPAPESNGMRWEVAADDETQITKLLSERLGLVVEAR
jgi:hypothetical protein